MANHQLWFRAFKNRLVNNEHLLLTRRSYEGVAVTQTWVFNTRVFPLIDQNIQRIFCRIIVQSKVEENLYFWRVIFESWLRSPCFYIHHMHLEDPPRTLMDFLLWHDVKADMNSCHVKLNVQDEKINFQTALRMFFLADYWTIYCQ